MMVRADAAFAKTEIYEVALEERDVDYAIRIPAKNSLERDITELLPPIKRFDCTAGTVSSKAKSIHSGKQKR